MKMSEPQYKMVNGELVEMTPEEIAEMEADREAQIRQQTMSSSNTNLDMGGTMNDILQ